jgi:hypothetical protein
MDPKEEKEIIESILKDRRLPYSIELLEVDGNKYTVRNNFGSTVIYIKKGENFFLEEDA